MAVDLEQARRDAALARRGAVAQRSHRPGQRRTAPDQASRSVPPVAFKTRMQTRSSTTGSGVHFTGLASAYEVSYEMWDFAGPYTEVVSAGAGAVSLARVDLDVPLVLQHESIRRIASTLTGTLKLTESDRGLEVDAPNLDPEDHDVAYILPKIRAGLVSEMSFAFTIDKGAWSPDYTEFRIQQYDLHRGDVAIVGFGASPYTLADIRSLAPGRDLVTLEETLRWPLIPVPGARTHDVDDTTPWPLA